ncbi:MAG TPA: hypothetical protein VGE06_09635 [Flavisolibacter sp.]
MLGYDRNFVLVIRHQATPEEATGSRIYLLLRHKSAPGKNDACEKRWLLGKNSLRLL